MSPKPRNGLRTENQPSEIKQEMLKMQKRIQEAHWKNQEPSARQKSKDSWQASDKRRPTWKKVSGIWKRFSKVLLKFTKLKMGWMSSEELIHEL